MAVPTVASTGWTSNDLSSGATGSVTKTRGANAKAAVAIVTAAVGGSGGVSAFQSNSGSLSYGNVSLPKITGASAAAANTIGTARSRRVEFFLLTDFSGCSDHVFRWEAPHEASTWSLSVAILDYASGGRIGVINTDTYVIDGGSDTGAADSDVILSAPFACLGLVASLCDNTVTNKTGQTTIHSNFFGVMHSMQSSEASVTSDTLGHVRSFTAGPWVAGGMLVGGIDYSVDWSTRIEVEVGFVTGFDPIATTDRVQSFVGPVINVGFVEGFSTAAAAPHQVMLAPIDLDHETTLTTEGGNEGDVLIFHEGSKPSWDTPGAASHPDLAAHDALGLATDTELAVVDAALSAHEADTTDAHDASAISVLDSAGLLTATDVEAAIAEVAASGSRVVQVYNVSGSPHTWSKPAATTKFIGCWVEVQGGGGGAGGIAATTSTTGASSGGGAAGGYCRKWFPASVLPSSCTATVGGGGAGGASGNNTGTAGTASSWSGSGITTMTGNGGGASGGSAAVASGRVGGGLGGTATGGDINITGGDGGEGNIVSNRGLTTGDGGWSWFGGIRRANSGANGQNGGRGAGGSGAAESNSSARAGGNGGDGIIVVVEVYA